MDNINDLIGDAANLFKRACETHGASFSSSRQNRLSPATLFGLNSMNPRFMFTLQLGSMKPIPSATELSPRSKLQSSYQPPGRILLVHALMLSQSKVWACVLNHSPLPLMNDSFRRTISIENVAPDSVLYAFQ